jgi:hypothetical protein
MLLYILFIIVLLFLWLNDSDIEYIESSNYTLTTNENGGYDIVYFTEVNVQETTYVSILNNVNYLAEIKNLYKQISLTC